MHILILVTTLLMLLAIIGSTRFELFLSSMGIRTAYERYMQEDERKYYNSREKAKYDDPPTPPKSSTPAKPKEESLKAPKAIAKLNIGPLIAEDQKVTEYYTAVKKTLIRLIENTYGSQKFFKEIRPADFVDVLINEARQGVCGGPIKRVDEMAGIKFQDPVMRKIFYEMIKDRGEGPKVLPSLLSFLTIRSSDTPIRVYLAKRQLLLALYEGPAVVNQVMEYRQHPFDVYIPSSEALLDSATADDSGEVPELASDDQATMQKASEQFKIQSFNSQRYPDIPESFLDFTVSGATPPK